MVRPNPPKLEPSRGIVTFCVGILTCRSRSSLSIAESGLAALIVSPSRSILKGGYSESGTNTSSIFTGLLPSGTKKFL